MRIHGWDLSLNHLGIIEIEDGEVTRVMYVTSLKGSADLAKKYDEARALRLSFPKDMDADVMAMHRLQLNRRFLALALKARRPHLVGIEDYAMSRAQGAHQMGELGGLARTLLWEAGIPFRAYDPGSVKMFATGFGDADKHVMREGVLEKWGMDFSKYDAPPSAKTGKQTTTTSEDLVDAYAVARLVEMEHKLRTGEVALTSLKGKELQVFNRTTKRRPVNILGREWIRREP